MTSGPVIYLLENGAVRWRDADGRVGSAENIAGAVAAIGSTDGLVAIAPGEAATWRVAAAPSGSGQQARAAAGFAVEDDLAADLDAVHVALGADAGAGRVVAVCDAVLMAAWIEALRAADVEPAAMVPDSRLLAEDASAVSVLLDGDRAVVRAPSRGFAAERDTALALAEAIASSEGLRLLVVHGGGEAAADAPPGAERAAFGGDAFDRLAEAVAGRDLDLQQGPFSRRVDYAKAVRPWRPAAAFAGLAALLWAGAAIAETVRMRAAADANRDAAEAVFERAFPGVRRVGDVAAQARARANALAGGGAADFLRISDAIAAVRAEKPDARLLNIRYSDSGRSGPEANAELRYPRFQDIETIRDVLEREGVEVEETSTRQEADGVVSSVRLRLRA